MEVAVKVVEKLAFTKDTAVQCDSDVGQEVNFLTTLADVPGVVRLLSWSEGLFDVHMVFRMHPSSLHDVIQRGALTLVSKSQQDIMPGICKQLLLALDHVHTLKIVHTDIKPANILVDDFSAVGENKGPKVVIADFGGARQLEVSANTARSFHVLAGARDTTTYQFRAPELFLKRVRRSCSFATDVWAMGVTFVVMDIGKVPFGREKIQLNNVDEIFVQQLKILFKAKADAFTENVRNDPVAFNKKLSSCKLVEPHALPWGRTRGVSFQKFMRLFFTPFPPSRPLAGTLLRDEALPK
jgi:serine/threonine protein kinase